MLIENKTDNTTSTHLKQLYIYKTCKDISGFSDNFIRRTCANWLGIILFSLLHKQTAQKQSHVRIMWYSRVFQDNWLTEWMIDTFMCMIIHEFTILHFGLFLLSFMVFQLSFRIIFSLLKLKYVCLTIIPSLINE